MTLASGLPEGMVGAFDKVAGFFNRRLTPMVGFSSAAVGAVSDMLPSRQGKGPYMAPGVDVRLAEFEQRMRKTLIEKVFSENVEGLGQDALLLLKRTGHEDFWGEWRDHDRFVTLLAEKERELNADEKLRVEVFFSESDSMIGTGSGPKWFDECWSEEKRGDGIDYTSCVVPKSDHDSIVSLNFGVFGQILRAIGGGDGGESQTVPPPPAEQLSVQSRITVS